LGVLELRKAITTIAVACAFIAGASGVAEAAKSHVSLKRCGHRYTPSCTPPRIANKTPSPQCVSQGASYKLPTITFTSNAGLKKIQVVLGNRTIKMVSFKGSGPTKYSVQLPVPTVDLLAGAHSISVTVTDVRKKTVHKTLHFSVCQAKPEFTG
jgi:hypothetical protein